MNPFGGGDGNSLVNGPPAIPINAKAFVRWGSMWHVAHKGASVTFCGKRIGANAQWHATKPGGMAHCSICARHVNRSDFHGR